ncbi:MAG: DUF1080 domain-containing protein [Pirellulaceae bacterium]|nr:DUF1080 domain-containing protein [Pirellulaceae bacterium]
MDRSLSAIAALFIVGFGVLVSAGETGVRTKVFTGENLHGWHVTGCEAVAENGVLLLKSGDGFIRTDSRYRDFVLELSYRALQNEKYDAGIYIRAELPPPGKNWPSQYQVNLKSGDELNLIKFPKARSTGLVKPGEWNHLKLTVVGGTAKMEINGQPAWETDGIEARDGYIGFQSEVPLGGQFEFKDIYITELGYQPLFDGQSLAGWEGAGQPAEKCWKVEDGQIVCTGEKGPWLRSKQEYGDFNLRLDYKLKAGGNSGVYIRVPENGNHHGDGAGIEVQVLDDKDDRYKSLKNYQYTGSLYAIAPAIQHVGRPAGEWNSLEINCRGTFYHVVHNGVQIIGADEASFPGLKGRLTKGFLGLQNHSEAVWYRNVRIGPAAEMLALPPPVPGPPPPPAKTTAVPTPPSAEQLGEILKTPILTEGTPQKEVEAYCEARVVRLPAADAPERKSAAAWKAYADKVRQDALDQVVFRGEAAKWRDANCKAEWQETIDGGEGYRIKKLRYEAIPGLWIPALLYEPTKLDAKAAVFLNVNGHDGKGKAAGYKQIRCINLAKRGVIALNLEWMGMGQLRSPGFSHGKINQLDLCGTSGVATHFLAMSRGLDILLAHPNADATRVGVAGLSGGGWQTIFISGLDPRVTLANPVAGYASFLTRIAHYSDLGDSEQTPTDLGAVADYAHLTALLAPRVALLTFNEKDNCCFAAPHALPPLLEAARPVFALAGVAENLHDHINYDPGNHNFERDNREALYKVIARHWFAGDTAFSPTEIPCADEVKTSEQLAVALPDDNLDLQKIAENLMQSLPAGKADRAAVRSVLRLDPAPGVKVAAEKSDEEKIGAWQVTRWKLRVAGEWTLPIVEIGSGKEAALVIADGGRATTAAEVNKLLAAGKRVVALDPFYLGESKIKNKDWLFAILISSVGVRPLGVQAQQLAAASAWLKAERGASEVRLHATGPRTSLMALAAAASDPAIDGAVLVGSLGSLKEVISQGLTVDKAPEQFCFGLLQTADIPQLAEIAGTQRIEFVRP